MELIEKIDAEYDKADALSGRCDIPRDTLLGWKVEIGRLLWYADYMFGHYCQQKQENKALREYATHKPGCHEGGEDCICGLDALLA